MGLMASTPAADADGTFVVLTPKPIVQREPSPRAKSGESAVCAPLSSAVSACIATVMPSEAPREASKTSLSAAPSMAPGQCTTSAGVAVMDPHLPLPAMALVAGETNAPCSIAPPALRTMAAASGRVAVLQPLASLPALSFRAGEENAPCSIVPPAPRTMKAVEDVASSTEACTVTAPGVARECSTSSSPRSQENAERARMHQCIGRLRIDVPEVNESKDNGRASDWPSITENATLAGHQAGPSFRKRRLRPNCSKRRAAQSPEDVAPPKRCKNELPSGASMISAPCEAKTEIKPLRKAQVKSSRTDIKAAHAPHAPPLCSVTDDVVDVRGLDKEYLLYHLWLRARAFRVARRDQGRGTPLYNPAQARAALRYGGSLFQLCGRVLDLRCLADDQWCTLGFDRANGCGALARAVASLRDG